MTYQKLTLAVRKKLLVSLMYPAVLIVVVICLIVFLVTYVVPNFAALYSSMRAQVAGAHAHSDRGRNYGAQLCAAGHWPPSLAAAPASGCGHAENRRGRRWTGGRCMCRCSAKSGLKYQVAQFSRVLGTLLIGGIPLVQALETSGRSLGTVLLKKSLDQSLRAGTGRADVVAGADSTGIFPSLAIDMMEVGESTGALPQMLNSVAEFYEEDVSTRMTALLIFDRAGNHDFHGYFRGVRASGLIHAYLFTGGYDGVINGHRNNQNKYSGSSEQAQARTLAARYCCEFVDLKESPTSTRTCFAQFPSI